MILTSPLPCLAVALTLTTSPIAAPQEDPRSWVWFEARESELGPRLELVREGAKPVVLRAEADSVLISYLAQRSFGRLSRLSLSLGDTNRVLLRFPQPPAGEYSKAMLILRMHPSQRSPRLPFEIALHAVSEAWSETAARWSAAPAFGATPLRVSSVDPKSPELRIELPADSQRWRHGLLLKVAEAVGGGAVPRGSGELPQLIERVLRQYRWARDVPSALARAQQDGRLVLAFTYAGNRQGRSAHEKLLATTLLAHPQLVELVGSQFVPTRIEERAWSYIYPAEQLRRRDPLRVLGTSLSAARAPGLVVASAKGEHVATLASLGTYDHELVTQFLRGALGKAGKRLEPEPKRPAGLHLLRIGDFEGAVQAFSLPAATSGEERYWHAALLERLGDATRARSILSQLAAAGPREPWSLLASLRLADPLRLQQCQPLRAPHRADTPVELVRGGLDYLLEAQRTDGSWPVAAKDAIYCIPGVTVLSARALNAWRGQLQGKRASRVDAALERAEAWLQKNIAQADAATLNSFAAAYYLDYELERYASAPKGGDAERAKAVKQAITQLTGGVCQNGAWAYDKRFGENWRGGIGGWPRTKQGRTHSCNTGPAMAALARARTAGFDVDDELIAGGIRALRAMRKRTGVYTYTWPLPRNFEKEDSSIARASVCELALYSFEASRREELRQTLDLFMRHRQSLRDVAKLSKGWLPPHAFSSYFYFFAYLHASEALQVLGAKEDLRLLHQDLIHAVEADGTWVDYEDIGKSYGTAMALLVLERSGLVLY